MGEYWYYEPFLQAFYLRAGSDHFQNFRVLLCQKNKSVLSRRTMLFFLALKTPGTPRYPWHR